METNGLVGLTVDGNVAIVALTRADRANSMDGAVFTALVEVLDEVRGRDDIRAVVLCGDGR
ncbi:MAG TPA: hypothetical protein PLV68_09025, partial [Ilumatobacteraceae bacterium]|nr:hypothetical protein [Ilumatobacteraceae bacterium]